MGVICRRLEVPVLAIGGFSDHAHVFIALPPTLALAEFMQKLKANSSRWIREQTQKPFAWQESYGGFSVGISQTAATVRYIQDQPRHHRKRSFDDEIRAILAKHGMTYSLS